LLLLPAAADARIDSAAFDTLSFRQHPGAQLPLDAALIDESGHPLALAGAFRNRPALLVLEYLRCENLCSLVLRGAVHSLQEAGLKPGRDVDLIAVSIDPRDSVADAAAARTMYAAAFSNPSATSGMHFLTGSPVEVARLASAVGFPYRFDKGSGQYAHPAGFVVTTPSGRISRYMLGLDPPSESLRQAVAQAGAGDVAPAVHPLLLLCFGYDPDEGTAAALAMRLVRWVSAAAVLGAILLIAFLSFRRKAA
jgi:protein SCO1/2